MAQPPPDDFADEGDYDGQRDPTRPVSAIPLTLKCRAQMDQLTTTDRRSEEAVVVLVLVAASLVPSCCSASS